MVYFQEGDVRQVVATPARKTQLTDYNLHNPGTNVRYCDYPKHFTFKRNKDGVYWCVRQRMFDTIGRVHTVHPLAGDVFYLRILLNTDHSRGKTSFEYLRTVNGQLQTSYQETCQILGLLQDDGEWDMVLHDAATLQLCPQIRELFTVLLLNCHPANPLELFNTHCHEWWDDVARLMPEPQDKILLRAMVLLDVESRMAGKELLDFSLPDVSAEVHSQVDQVNGLIQVRHLPVVVQEELTYDRDSMCNTVIERMDAMMPSQRAIFDEVFDAVKNNLPLAILVDARGGTGKTFILNTLLAAVRTMNEVWSTPEVALAVASSGIAATLLKGGRTFHSRFKAPIHPTATSTCSIPVQSATADLIHHTRLIVWDEAPMAHRFLLEALDITLHDIMRNDVLFGGKESHCVSR